MTRDRDPEDGNWLAADHALGVLDMSERLRAERLRREDAGFAAEVEAWEARLAPLSGAVSPQAPPARLWAAIERELVFARGAEAPPAPLAPAPAAVSSAVPLRGGVASFWRWLALGSTTLLAASLAGLAILVVGPATPPAGPMMAAISDTDGRAMFTAVLDPAAGHAMLMPALVPMPEGRVPELWLIPENGRPISLGLLDPGRPHRVALGREGMPAGVMRPGAAMLAVSAEPPGGSPTGQPTGPVMGQGALREI